MSAGNCDLAIFINSIADFEIRYFLVKMDLKATHVKIGRDDVMACRVAEKLPGSWRLRKEHEKGVVPPLHIEWDFAG